jgi:hypothetical protein
MAKPSLICCALPKQVTDERSLTEPVGTASASIRPQRAFAEIDEFRPSMRNPLDKSSAAQILDGDRLMGSLHFPESHF